MANFTKQAIKAAFLELLDVNAGMVCGGTRCTGAEYAEIIADFD